MTTTGFAATHVIPEGGIAGWAEPDPRQEPSHHLENGLFGIVHEFRPDGWACIEFENGWSCWVDGRLLIELGSNTRTAPGYGSTQAIGPVAMAGAAFAIVGGWLPWYRAGSISLSAWKIPVWSLVDETSTAQNPKVGPFLLLTALVVVPRLLGRDVPRAVTVALGAIATNAAGLAFVLWLKFNPRPTLGVGIVLTFVGGAAIVFDHVLSPRVRSWIGAR